MGRWKAGTDGSSACMRITYSSIFEITKPRRRLSRAPARFLFEVLLLKKNFLAARLPCRYKERLLRREGAPSANRKLFPVGYRYLVVSWPALREFVEDSSKFKGNIKF